VATAHHGFTDLAGTPLTTWPDDLEWNNLAATTFGRDD
jgi:hypothetical protein